MIVPAVPRIGEDEPPPSWDPMVVQMLRVANACIRHDEAQTQRRVTEEEVEAEKVVSEKERRLAAIAKRKQEKEEKKTRKPNVESMMERAMDPFEVIPVRFHFGGEIDYDGYSLNYNGGRTEMCHIDRDKLSLPELKGYLGDHVAINSEDNVEFYWLFPGADMNSGLRKLGSDKDCMSMSQCITEGVVAEVFADIYKLQGGDIVMCSAGEASATIKVLESSGSQKAPVKKKATGKKSSTQLFHFRFLPSEIF
ncbi:hypothetical protein EJB05_27874, partial [Eragrostis curvula]